MKDFIKHKVRLVLEAKYTSDSPSNPTGIDKHKASNKDLERTLHKIVTYNNEYGQDEYFQNTHEGDGIYLATVHTNGNVGIKTPNNTGRIQNSNIGLMTTGQRGNLHVYIKAYRGVEHTNYQNPDANINSEKTGVVRTKSPANDAAIKVYINFGKEILEYVKQNMDGESAYTSDVEDKNFKEKTPDKWKYKYDKLEKEKAFANKKKVLSMEPDEAEEYEKKQAKLRDKYAELKKRRGL